MHNIALLTDLFLDSVIDYRGYGKELIEWVVKLQIKRLKDDIKVYYVYVSSEKEVPLSSASASASHAAPLTISSFIRQEISNTMQIGMLKRKCIHFVSFLFRHLAAWKAALPTISILLTTSTAVGYAYG